jgi:hypothetical protein
MTRNIEKLFRAPYALPNGIQMTDEGLWVADQISDRVALVTLGPKVGIGTVVENHGVTQLIREIPSESSNTSGLGWDGSALWLAANGGGSLWRPARPTDAPAHDSDILRVDPHTGATLARYKLPGGGGTHGLEIDRYEPGIIWLTTLKTQTMSKVRMADWSIQHVLTLPYERAHGVVRVEDGIWVVFTSRRVIVKMDVNTGRELDRIDVPQPHPEPHCLSNFGNDLLYCDATSGWIAQITV